MIGSLMLDLQGPEISQEEKELFICPYDTMHAYRRETQISES